MNSDFLAKFSAASDEASLAFMETSLKTLELHITTKKAELAYPTPMVKRSLATRGGLPRILFMSMQQDLNNSFSADEAQNYRNSTQKEIASLCNKRDRLAEEIREMKSRVKVETNGHTHEFAKEASPAEVILFTKREVG